MYSGALFAVLWILALCGLSEAFPSGASPKACVQMVPGHISSDSTPLVPQESASPFSIVADGTEYNPGGTVQGNICSLGIEISYA